MANNKTGLAYWSFDTDRYMDRKIKRLKNNFGPAGIAIYDYILNEVYRDKGCFIEWDENTAFDVADYFNVKEALVNEIVNYCTVVGLFSKELLSSESVITSTSIQERYVAACKKAKRTKIEIPENIRLTDIIPEDSDKLPEESPKLPEESPQNSGSLKQSKVKESKVKKSKEEVNNSVGLNYQERPQPADPPTPDYKGLYALLSGEFNQMILTNAGVTALLANNLSRYGPDAVRYILTRLSDRKPSQYNAPNYVRKVIEGETETLVKIKAGKLDRFGQDPNKKNRPKHIPPKYSKSFTMKGTDGMDHVWWYNSDPIHKKDGIYHECIKESNGYTDLFPKKRVDELLKGIDRFSKQITESLTRGQQQ